MGYSVPRSEDVYQYLCRIDHGRASLNDGFSWSILFINDDSETCRDFLKTYGMELCHRTADRIRFVFFSGLDQPELDPIADEARRSGRGFLSRIIDALPFNRQQRYDWERPVWERYRPSGYNPLDSSDKISRELNWQAETYSAMPGSREAFRLSQRLGIGRFVPCFLFFRDIGAPSVKLWPVSNKDPREMYEVLKYLIDDFYEVNQNTLNYWSVAERSIEEACRAFRLPLTLANEWKQQQEASWELLKKLNYYIAEMQKTGTATILKKIDGDWKLPYELRSPVGQFLENLKKSSKNHQLLEKASSWMAVKPAEASYHQYQAYLQALPFGKNEGMPYDLARQYELLAGKTRPALTTVSLTSELQEWWRHRGGVALSKRKYRWYKSSWDSFSFAKYGAAAQGNIPEIIGAAYEIVVNCIYSYPICLAADSAAEGVLAALAEHFETPADDREWVACTAEFKQVLISYISSLQVNIPKGIPEADRKHNYQLTWGDCIIRAEVRDQPTSQWLSGLPRLTQIWAQVEEERDSLKKSADTEAYRNLEPEITAFLSAFTQWTEILSLTERDIQPFINQTTTLFSAARQQLEKEVFQQAKEVAEKPYPGEAFNQTEAMALLEKLEQYQSAYTSIRYPYEDHPDVLNVRLDQPLNQAFTLPGDATQEETKYAALNREIRKTVGDAKRSYQNWEQFKASLTGLSPAGKLCEMLQAIAGPVRWKEILYFLSAEDLPTAIGQLADGGQILRLLNFLDVHELLALEKTVQHQNSHGAAARPASKKDLFNLILQEIALQPLNGLDRDIQLEDQAANSEKLKKKVDEGLFDVFLAHHSLDKADVLMISNALRSKGIYPWIDVEQIPPGKWFQDIIQSAVTKVKAAAVFIGPQGIGKWQALEIRSFLTRCVESDIPLIPVLLPGVKKIPDSLPFLRELNYVQFENNINEEQSLMRLAWGITGRQ